MAKAHELLDAMAGSDVRALLDGLSMDQLHAVRLVHQAAADHASRAIVRPATQAQLTMYPPRALCLCGHPRRDHDHYECGHQACGCAGFRIAQTV